jgi:hypothetical protein
MHICTGACTYVHAYMYVRHVHTLKRSCGGGAMHAQFDGCGRLKKAYTHMHTSVHSHMHIHMHIHTCTHTCTCTCILRYLRGPALVLVVTTVCDEITDRP